MKYFWVNQKQTYQQESEGGFLWAPQESKTGRTMWHWDSMKKISKGDLVFCYVNGRICAFGIVTQEAITSKKPESMENNTTWEKKGWLVKMKYHHLNNPIFIEKKLDKIGNYFPDKYSPYSLKFRRGNQIYLAEINDKLGVLLLEYAKVDLKKDYQNTSNNEPGSSRPEKSAAPSIETREQDAKETDKPFEFVNNSLDPNTMTETDKETVLKVRTKQGKFRDALRERYGDKCCLTGLSEPALLIASHIKPFSKCDDFERQDPNNGLLLASHIDALFDKNFISFYNDGTIIISERVSMGTRKIMGIERGMKMKFPITDENKIYLAYHRSKLVR